MESPLMRRVKAHGRQPTNGILEMKLNPCDSLQEVYIVVLTYVDDEPYHRGERGGGGALPPPPHPRTPC
jgi:hypothetical protein